MFGLVQEPIQSEKTPFYPRSPYAAAKRLVKAHIRPNMRILITGARGFVASHLRDASCSIAQRDWATPVTPCEDGINHWG
jgi:dTDP-D-glucose 4,6-dehydratase